MHVSNYRKQAEAVSPDQFAVLMAADYATRVREISRIAIAVGIIATVTSPIYGHDLFTSINMTTASALIWLISHYCAEKTEQRANEIVSHYRTQRAQKEKAPTASNKDS